MFRLMQLSFYFFIKQDKPSLFTIILSKFCKKKKNLEIYCLNSNKIFDKILKKIEQVLKYFLLTN